MKDQDTTTKQTNVVTIELEDQTVISWKLSHYLYSYAGTIIIAQHDSNNWLAFCTPDGLGLPGQGEYRVDYPDADSGPYRLRWAFRHNGNEKYIKTAGMRFSSSDFQRKIDGFFSGVLDDETEIKAKFSYTKTD